MSENVYAMMPYEDYVATCDAIREKTGTNSLIKSGDMAGIIEGISGDDSGSNNDIATAILNKTISGAYTNSKMTSIYLYTFYDCRSLETISFPACTNIYNSAFAYCTSLTSVSFPKCETIGSYAFEYCISLTSVSFPACANIGSNAFYSCSSLTSVSFPKCAIIYNNAFNDYSSLTSVSFQTCTDIGNNAFERCTSLTSVSFPKCSVIASKAFNDCFSLTSVSFPECTTIGTNAFYDCESLTLVSFPACTYIGSNTFYGCNNLISFYLVGSSLCTLLNSNAFRYTPIAKGGLTGVNYYGSIYVPSALLSKYQSATNWTYFSNRFVGLDIDIGDVTENITFTIDGVEYQAYENWTWDDWVNSLSHNTNNFFIFEDDYAVLNQNGHPICNSNGSQIYSADIIIANEEYYTDPGNGYPV